MKELIKQAFKYVDKIGYPNNNVLDKNQCVTLMVSFARQREIAITKAYQKTYSKPLSIWRVLFCSNKSNQEWYRKRHEILTNGYYKK